MLVKHHGVGGRHNALAGALGTQHPVDVFVVQAVALVEWADTCALEGVAAKHRCAETWSQYIGTVGHLVVPALTDECVERFAVGADNDADAVDEVGLIGKHHAWCYCHDGWVGRERKDTHSERVGGNCGVVVEQHDCVAIAPRSEADVHTTGEAVVAW